MDYKDKRWIKLRGLALKRDKYLCQWSLRFGIRKDAHVVHHIYPVEIYPEYQWCLWNLISLADDSVHNKMHIRGSHELTPEGKKLMKRVEKQKQEYDAINSIPSPTSIQNQ